MKFSARARALAISVSTAAVLLLSGCTSPTTPQPQATPEVLSASEAGGIYLDAVCPVNAAWDAADLEIDRLRLTVSRGESDTTRVAEALTGVAAESKTAAVSLDPKVVAKADHAWPADALEPIAAVRESLSVDVKQASAVTKLAADELLNYSWRGVEETAAAASAARAVLGLPTDGANACAQWQEQLDAEKQAAREAAGAEKPKSEQNKTEKAD